MKNENEPSEETKRQWHQDPNNWFLGIFYYNVEDKRILPPKRIAWMGWTVNFANPLSVSLLLIILLIAFTFVGLNN
ncbi:MULTISPECIES: DUF5808 domain-containing protein [Flavobacterium]|uniref:DUF5808 domain-containing protein n=1 Tax=Flavobacterium TaxID=237 RepID=UPI000EF9B583|nr:DUF5808 domain-containing protein [Flavobacterium weaverense]